MPISTIGSAGLDQAANVTLCTTSGSVGIGTSSPTRKLVVSNAGAQGFEFGAGVGSGSGNELLNYNRSTSLYVPASLYASTHTFYVGTAGGTRAVDINSSGNVGIGTTNPVRSLVVSNNGAEGLEIGPGDKQGDASGGVTAIYYNRATSAYIQNIQDASLHIWRTTGSERMRIAADGTVSTGTLTPTRIAMSGNTGVPPGTSNGQGFISTYTAYGLTLLGQGSSYDISFFNKNGSFAGYVATGATTITTSSDERLKENNQPITGALDIVCQMRHETGNYKSDPSRTVAFLIAQDVDKLFPYAVEKADPESWGVNYNWIIPLHGAAITELTALVKEQQAIITQLQADVAALKGQA